MILGSPRTDGGGGGNSQVISIPVKKTIQSIKEIVRNHSESEIYAMLKETNMDPNETTQKLLNQDPFHEVKRKRDKKKEHAGYSRGFADTGKPMEHTVQWAKPPTSWDRNAWRGGYGRSPAPGISRKFRIVRDNRVINSDAKPETSQLQASGSQQVQSNVPEKNSAEVLTYQKHSAARNPVVSQGVNEPCDSRPPCTNNSDPSGSHSPSLPEESQTTVSASALQLQREVNNNSHPHATSTSRPTPTSSVIGVYSSSSDPVHVPSPDSRAAGTVGAIRREVGVVGVRRPSSDRPTMHSTVSNTNAVSSLRKDISSSPAESFGHTASVSKGNQLSQTSASSSNVPSIPTSRSFSNNQYNSKLHQQAVGHQKALPPSMEWKPKPSQKSTAISAGVVGTTSALSSSFVDNSRSSTTVDVAGSPEKITQVNIPEKVQYVIIPQHLRAPESERTRLAFGSFGAGFDSFKGSTSARQATESTELLNDGSSGSVSASLPVGSVEDASAADQGDLVDSQARTSRSDSPVSDVESDQPPSGHNEPLRDNIDGYAEIGLVQSHSPPYSSPEPPQLQNPSRLPSYSNSVSEQAYDTQTSYDVPFFRTAMDDNVRGQVLASHSEALSSHAVNSSPLSSASATTQQLQVQQQQQAVAQLYPQLQISHFQNFVPYRHIFSPVYVPPMAIPNYPTNPSYPHPSSGSSYVLMPGGSSHLTAGGMKYAAASQYKPVPAANPAGYGNFTNQAGFTISAPASMGAASGLEDVARIKYKDNNLYVPNGQAESSDIWIQTPREIPGLQSAPYYNIPGQAAHATFMPTHAGHGSFNAAAAQSSHMQYSGLYHPPQPASMQNSHHLVHQQVNPGFGAGVGVGVAAPGPPQLGTYQQQPQVSHLNWTTNF